MVGVARLDVGRPNLQNPDVVRRGRRLRRACPAGLRTGCCLDVGHHHGLHPDVGLGVRHREVGVGQHRCRDPVRMGS